jgi:succinate dehydrogenase / fumarate reductase, membrane anchor subunit
MSEIAAPRSSSRARNLKGGGRNRSGQTNFELYSWLFMRLSGLALVILVLGHLFVNLMLGGGITALDFGFVAGKWANPFWQVWDLAMLWLAMLHGGNGLRTIINDYTTRPNSRFALKTLLYFGTAVVIVLGTLVIFTFDPCIDPNSTLDVCRMK